MNNELLFGHQQGRILIVLAHPLPCTCDRMTAFMVNRDGRTRCVECDEKYVQTQRKTP